MMMNGFSKFPVLTLAGMLLAMMIDIGTAGAAPQSVETVSLDNLCSFASRDYDRLRPRIIEFFPRGMTMKAAAEKLTKHGLKYVQRREDTAFPDPAGKKAFITRKTVSLLATVTCDLPHNNQNQWDVEVWGDGGGLVDVADFALFMEGDNFARRGVALEPRHLLSRESLVKCLQSLRRERFSDWAQMERYLEEKGFGVANVPQYGGSVLHGLEIPPDLTRVLGRKLPLYAMGMLLSVMEDPNGNLRQVNKPE